MLTYSQVQRVGCCTNGMNRSEQTHIDINYVVRGQLTSAAWTPAQAFPSIAGNLSESQLSSPCRIQMNLLDKDQDLDKDPTSTPTGRMHRTPHEVPTTDTETQGFISPIEEPQREPSGFAYVAPSRIHNPLDEVPVHSPPSTISRSSLSAPHQDSESQGLSANHTERAGPFCQSLRGGHASLVAHYSRTHPNLPTPPHNRSGEYCHDPFQSHKVVRSTAATAHSVHPFPHRRARPRRNIAPPSYRRPGTDCDQCPYRIA